MQILQNIKALARSYKRQTLYEANKGQGFSEDTKKILLDILSESALLSEKELDAVVDAYCDLIKIDQSCAMIADILPIKITRKHKAIMAILDCNPFFISLINKKDQTLGMANKVYKVAGQACLCFLRENLRNIVSPYSPRVDEWNKKIFVPEYPDV